jgi:hypothetical protein
MHNAITSCYASIEKTIAAKCASLKTFVTFWYVQLKIYIPAYNE